MRSRLDSAFTRSREPSARARFAWLLIGLLALAPGCTSVVDVSAPDPDRVRKAGTWALLDDVPAIEPVPADPRRVAARRVRSPARDPLELEHRILAALEAELSARGYTRVESAPDLYVHYRLRLQPEVRTVEVPLAARTLHSFSDQPSYVIEGTNLETRETENMQLLVQVRAPKGRILWSGSIESQLQPVRDLPLAASVAEVLASFPERAR